MGQQIKKPSSRKRSIWPFDVVVLQRTAKKCNKNYNARAQPLFSSLNLLFSDVPAAVAVVVFLNSPLVTAAYLDRRSPHGFLKRCFAKCFWRAPLVEDNPAATQMPTTDQPNNRRMLLGKWIGVEILINGCHVFPFKLVVKICGTSRNIINLVVHHYHSCLVGTHVDRAK